MNYTKWLVLVAAEGLAEQCLSRDYGNGGTVCVCNAKHCDKIQLEAPKPGDSAVVYTSNKDGLRFQKKVQQFVSDEKDHEDQIIIGNQTYQRILGFGGAFTDSTGINILKMDKAIQKKILRSYFSKDGLEYSLGRVPIGGTDFSTRAYSYVSEKIPIIKRARRLAKNLRLLSSAWTAPKWMKSNGKYTGPVSFLKEEYYQQWADYHVKFLDGYAKHNRKWIQNNLGPAVRKSNHSKIRLMALDDQIFLLPFYMDIMFKSKKVEEYIDGIAVHWYEEGVSPSLSLTDTHKSFPEKFILATEASLDLGGGPSYYKNFLDAPVIVNPEAGEFYKQPMFYAMGHFSKFIPPGSYRIETERSSNDISAAGFKRPDGMMVLVILNKSTSNRQLTIKKLGDKKKINLTISKKSFTTILM
nr:unnamed protein product [Callosobruchus chinensis]